MQGAHFLGLFPVGHPVESRFRLAASLQLAQPAPGPLAQLLNVAELDRCRRAGLGARRCHVVLQAVVAERALVGRAGLEVAIDGRPVDHAERTGGHAVAAAVADVLLDIDGAEFRANE